MKLQFLAPVELIFKQLKWNYHFLKFTVFPLCGLSCLHLVIRKGIFNHCGRSKAWNSTHHGRYVFQTTFFFS